MNRDDLVSLILAALKESAADPKAVEFANADTALIGPNSPLDSIAFVTALLQVEQALREKYKISITIADEKAMSQRNSPFRTIGTLAEHVAEKIGGFPS